VVAQGEIDQAFFFAYVFLFSTVELRENICILKIYCIPLPICTVATSVKAVR
jgi:hypothetical protein